MPIYSLTDLYPVYEQTAKEIKPSNAASYPLVEQVIYFVMRIDGELRNGGVAQLIWNLQESYEYELLYSALEEIGAKKAKKLVQKGVDYIYKTEERKENFFREGPFGAGKFFERITDNYYDLSPSVSAQLLEYIEGKWQDKAFKKVIKKLNLESILKIDFTTEQVFEAISEADKRLVQQMLAAGLDLTIKDKRGATLLMECFQNSSSPTLRQQLAKLLVEAGADLEATNKYGETVLCNICSFGGNLAYIQCLIELGANLEQEGIRGRTPIFDLTRKAKNLQFLVDAGANIHHKTLDGFTPLGAAFSALKEWTDNTTNKLRGEFIREVKKSIKILMNNGAEFSTTVIHQFKKTELSDLTSNPKLLKELIQHPSFQNVPEWTEDIGVWTGLHEASQAGDVASLKALLEAGLKPTMKLEVSDLERLVFAGATPLDVAKNKKIEKILQEYGAEKGTPFYYALYLKTRGEQPKELATALKKLKGITLEEGLELVESLPQKEGDYYQFDEEYNLTVYKDLLLDTYPNAAAAQEVANTFSSMNVSTQIL